MICCKSGSNVYTFVSAIFKSSDNQSEAVSKTPGEKAASNDEYVSILIGALAALIFILTLVVVFVIIRYKRQVKRRQGNNTALKPLSDTVLNINLNNYQNNVNGKVSNGNVYNGVATDDDEHDKGVNGKGKLYWHLDRYL